MIDLFIIILLLVSLVKPEVLLSKKLKEEASESQKKILIKNIRKSYSLLVALIESMAISRYQETIGWILTLIMAILVATIAIPAGMANKKIKEEIKLGKRGNNYEQE